VLAAKRGELAPTQAAEDGEGQAKGQARRRAANLCRSTTPIGGKDGRARASYESSPVAMLNPSLCFLHGCPRSS
jgi:hypothetical protein